MSGPTLTTDDRRQATSSSARLHALAAALCALLLLVALCLMVAAHAPWWALLATQGALLVATASAGMWLDRAQGAGGRGQATEEDWLRELGQMRTWSGTFRYTLPERNGCGRREDDDVFWQERAPGRKEDEG